jgi:hypothetical protein
MKTAHIYRRFRFWLAHRTRAQLRFWGAFSGFVLAQGAPIGLLFHTYLTGPQHPATFWQHVEESLTSFSSIYFYVWIGSTVYFMAFGFTLSALMGSYWQEYRRSRSAMILFAQFDQLRTYFRKDIQQKLKSPAATIEEFMQGLNEGLFGKFTDDQRQTLHAFLADLLKSHKTANEALAPKSSHASLRDLIREHKLDITFAQSDASFGEMLDTALAVDPNLFRGAIHEIFLELQKIGKVTLQFTVTEAQSETHSLASWPRDQFIFFAFEIARPLRRVPEEWSIVRHIFEWYGGGFWTETGDARHLYFVIPRAKTKPNKTEAA